MSRLFEVCKLTIIQKYRNEDVDDDASGSIKKQEKKQWNKKGANGS